MSGQGPGDADGIGIATLFAVFLKIGALSFGGTAPLARHILVVERGLLDERGFAELFGFASTLPGANTVNLAIMLGDRHRGVRGAFAAVAGLLGAPLCALVVCAVAYRQYGGEADVRAALAGAAAAAAGLVGGTAIRLLRGLGRDTIAAAEASLVCLAAIVGAPLLAILGTAVPLSLTLRGIGDRRSQRVRRGGR